MRSARSYPLHFFVLSKLAIMSKEKFVLCDLLYISVFGNLELCLQHPRAGIFPTRSVLGIS